MCVFYRHWMFPFLCFTGVYCSLFYMHLPCPVLCFTVIHFALVYRPSLCYLYIVQAFTMLYFTDIDCGLFYRCSLCYNYRCSQLYFTGVHCALFYTYGLLYFTGIHYWGGPGSQRALPQVLLQQQHPRPLPDLQHRARHPPPPGGANPAQAGDPEKGAGQGHCPGQPASESEWGEEVRDAADEDWAAPQQTEQCKGLSRDPKLFYISHIIGCII